MFVGAIPRPVVAQALAVVDLSRTKDVFVCCSGSFRLEQALKQKYPDIALYSNDVSLLSCALGQLAVGRPLTFSFTNRLEFLERAVEHGDGIDRLAALGVAIKLGTYTGKSAHALAHFSHYEAHAASYVLGRRQKLEDYLPRLKLADFSATDFREHARRGMDAGAAIVAFPPTYLKGYETLYKFIDKNTAWTKPSYGLFDPATLGDWLGEMDERRASYVVCTDHELAGRKAAALYAPGRARRIYLYTSMARSASFRRDVVRSKPFHYEALDPWQLKPDSSIEVRLADVHSMNYIKDRYLAPGLVHSDGMLRCLVYVDGKLAGGFIYTQAARNSLEEIYLLCDFATSRERKLSKLIAMLATGQDTVRHWDAKKFVRIQGLVTTAFSKRPVSMKYRGIWELLNRKENFLNYKSEVRRVPNAEIYRDWWKRYGKAAVRAEPGGAGASADGAAGD